jgi:hypothetical protein
MPTVTYTPAVLYIPPPHRRVYIACNKSRISIGDSFLNYFVYFLQLLTNVQGILQMLNYFLYRLLLQMEFLLKIKKTTDFWLPPDEIPPPAYKTFENLFSPLFCYIILNTQATYTNHTVENVFTNFFL